MTRRNKEIPEYQTGTLQTEQLDGHQRDHCTTAQTSGDKITAKITHFLHKKGKHKNIFTRLFPTYGSHMTVLPSQLGSHQQHSDIHVMSTLAYQKD